MIPVKGYEGKRIGVLGLGRSGLATARALKAGGAEPVCWDDNSEAREAAGTEGFLIADLTKPNEARNLERLIVSPGIPHLYPAPHPAVEAALRAGVALDNDVGLFFENYVDFVNPASSMMAPQDDPAVILVTGSNGKSTTAALIAHMLEQAGRPVTLAGNIGRGVLDVDPPRKGEIYVIELSSYQTDLARFTTADVAVFTNLSDDHLDRHGGRGGYFAAKAQLFRDTPINAVIGVDEPEGLFLAERAALWGSDVMRVTLEKPGKSGRWISFAGGAVEFHAKGKRAAKVTLKPAKALLGAHNHQNAAMAFGACRALGMPVDDIKAGIYSFPGLPHRAERLAEIDGVLWINDSKATNADAAEKALLSYDKIRWIAGGVPKAGGIESLKPHLGRVRKTYLIGEAAEAFAKTLGDAPHEICGTLENAVARIREDAQKGEVALLSPACASFDQFKSFEHRGDAFRALVTEAGGA